MSDFNVRLQILIRISKHSVKIKLITLVFPTMADKAHIFITHIQ